jgi:hypothetical protein
MMFYIASFNEGKKTMAYQTSYKNSIEIQVIAASERKFKILFNDEKNNHCLVAYHSLLNCL